MGQITLQRVRKSFGPVNIIKDANLDIENGSFVVFVGPSGCGKTTLLRLIAGLEDVTGGQRQRVAIGRAIVREPKAFLFDEPLSNLDAALRVQMRLEVTKLQKQLGTTAVYVTHDQVEAMTMADKIVVLNAGHIEQYGSPLELYERPANLFVAGFIGSPKMNFVSGETAGQNGAATIGIRPEHLKIGKEGEGWPGTVSVAEHLGSDTFLYVDAGKLGLLTVRYIGELDLQAGDRVWLMPDPARLHRFDKEGGIVRT